MNKLNYEYGKQKTDLSYKYTISKKKNLKHF